MAILRIVICPAGVSWRWRSTLTKNVCVMLSSRMMCFYRSKQQAIRLPKKKYLRPVYKPHSVHGAEAPLCDHLSGRCVTAPLDAAYPELTSPPCEEVRMKTSSLPSSADDFVPAWPCSRRGLPGHPHYCECRWSFTPPFHHHHPLTLALSQEERGLPSPFGGKVGDEGGCLFLWPLSGRLAPHGGFPAPGAIRRRALWSADFPRSRQRRTAIAQPT
jgi:hypothetical protein